MHVCNNHIYELEQRPYEPWPRKICQCGWWRWMTPNE